MQKSFFHYLAPVEQGMSSAHAQHLDATSTYMEQEIYIGQLTKKSSLRKQHASVCGHYFFLPQQNQDDIGRMDSGSKQPDTEGGGTVSSNDCQLHSRSVHIYAHHRRDCF